MINRSALPYRVSLMAILVIAAACTGGGAANDGDETLDAKPVPSSAITTENGSETTDSNEMDDRTNNVIEGTDGLMVLPVRSGEREETTNNVPHVQVGAVPVPELDAELERRAYLLPGVEQRESTVSLPGARGLWLAEDLELARPEVLQAGREFAHIHPNGSLHIWLPVDRAIEVTETRWGALHPWVGREDFWDGLILIYTPETTDEVDVAIRLIVDAYNYVTGAEIDPETLR